MKELLVTIASALVEDKSAVQVTVDEPDAEGVVVYHLHVAQEDMGRVIGKQGIGTWWLFSMMTARL